MFASLKSLYQQSDLLWSLAVRDVQSRYRGTFLGLAWVLINPLLMLGVYAFVFGGIFQSRWLREGGIAEFVTMLYCGLIVHGLFAEVISRAPTAISSQPNFVKKIVFPIHFLPVVQVCGALFNAGVGLFILLVLMAAQLKFPAWTIIFVPILFLPLAILSLGIGWALASIGVFFRDLGQIVGIITSMLLFLSPVFYPAESAPRAAKTLIYLNPLTYPIEELRHVLIAGQVPHWGHLFGYLVVSSLIALAGLWFFQKSRDAFADVL